MTGPGPPRRGATHPDPATTLELATLSARYADAVDARDLDGFLGVFEADAVLEVVAADGHSTVLSGHHELAVVLDALARYDSTFHQVGHSRYRIEGEQAHGVVTCVAHHRIAHRTGDPEGPDGTRVEDRVSYLRYHDRYRRDAVASWRIAARTVRIEWTDVQLVRPVG